MQKRLAQINNKIAKDHTFLQTLPDTPYTEAGGNHGTNGGHAVEGMVGNEDLGEDARVGGDPVHYNKKHHHHRHHAQTRTLPDEPYTLPNGNKGVNGGHAVDGMVGTEDLSEDIKAGGNAVHFFRRNPHAHHAQTRTLPDEPYTLKDGNKATNGGHEVEGMVGDEDLGEDIRVGPDYIHYLKQKQRHHHHNHV